MKEMEYKQAEIYLDTAKQEYEKAKTDRMLAMQHLEKMFSLKMFL